MDAKTYLVVGAMMQAAAHAGGFVGPVEFTVCTPRQYDWCGVEDDYAEVTEEEFCSMEIRDLQETLDLIQFRDYVFVLMPEGDRIFLQGRYVEADTITGQVELQKTRKWPLSPHMTHSEVVQTVFKCAMTSMEHRTREHFLYKGERVYSPHYDVEALVELCRTGAFDEREAAVTEERLGANV